MEGHRQGDEVILGGDARQRLYDARGYGRPTDDGGIALAPVEAAHLLYRGEIASVDGQGFPAFIADASGADGEDLVARFLVYADLRERGFYLARPDVASASVPAQTDFVVFERGAGPPDGAVAYALRVVGERSTVDAASLGDVVLAVVDEESEVTYFETDRPSVEGSSSFTPPHLEGTLLSERVVTWDPPDPLYHRGFYGRPLGGREETGIEALQLSLVEAAYLVDRGSLSLEAGADAVLERGRAVEGDRFDRRLAVYSALREAGTVPKTGFKFGADFRVYGTVENVESLGHSEQLVRVIPADHHFHPRDLALDVRLAGGVRKQMVFALVADGSQIVSEDITWISVGRLTP
ncbi:MAG: tRNA-intron lyase [Halobacteriales archaeon]|nr:tRNA-intron lyase [Halobacteriales archaeon]